MAPRIPVSDETKKLLDKKTAQTRQSYDEILQEQLKQQPNLNELYGKYPNLQPFNKETDQADIDART